MGVGWSPDMACGGSGGTFRLDLALLARRQRGDVVDPGGLSRSEDGGERRARRRLQPWAAEKATQRGLPIGGVAPTLP